VVPPEPRVFNPDGLAFSRCGRWLATANYGHQSVSIFQRHSRIASGDKVFYRPKPVTVIEDPTFRYPHSVAFTPRSNHLIVTNAGANYFNVYEPIPHDSSMRWSQSPVVQVIAHDDEAFQEVNTANKMEGGPKGWRSTGTIWLSVAPRSESKSIDFANNLLKRSQPEEAQGERSDSLDVLPNNNCFLHASLHALVDAAGFGRSL
jgi:hypothetical protein